MPHPIAATLLLAAASGARSMLGVATASRIASRSRAAGSPRLSRILGDKHAPGATALLAALEVIGDKLPGAPDRIDAGPLVGRALAGAAIGGVIAEACGSNRATSTLIGAAGAVLSAHLTFRLRKRLMAIAPPVAAGMIEDAIVLGIAAAGVATLTERR